jgi:SAM-dependent methyltransferase
MKLSLLDILVCPECCGHLQLDTIEKESSGDVLTGLLLCSSCKLMYPIYDSVPRMFPYFLEDYKKFINKNKKKIKSFSDFSFPSGRAPKGEDFVRHSFSKEWAEYDYTGVIWNYTYEQRKNLFLWEVNMKENDLKGKLVFDAGCGNGVTSNLISKDTDAEVVGMDLSFSVVAATKEFAFNKHVNFVQGTLFKPPFKLGTFDIVYSHGVLHHTSNTKKAFLSIAPLCKSGGRCYVWLYGEYRGFGLLFNLLTNSIRTVVSRLPLIVQNPVVVRLAKIYGFARHNFRRYVIKSPGVDYNWKQTLHTARDRFTPLYAYTHNAKEVIQWFKDAGFSDPVFRPNFFDNPIYVGGVSVYGDMPKD